MWARIALMASAATPILHCLALFSSGQDAVRDPISELSQGEGGALQTVGLMAFGSAHIALAVALGGRDRGRLWPYGRTLLGMSGAIVFYIAWFYATAEPEALRGPEANDPLWIVATLVGVAMGALQPGLSRQSRPLGLFTAICLGVWLWLVPLILLVDASWMGAYERIVGTVYVTWIFGVSAALYRLDSATGTRR